MAKRKKTMEGVVEEISGHIEEALEHARELDAGKMIAAKRVRKSLQDAKKLISPARAEAMERKAALKAKREKKR